jgi:predicted DNA-binding protein with PD1-like motif
MHSRKIHEADGQRTFVVILDPGEEALSCLQAFAVEQRMTAAQVTAIGAFESAVLGFWNGDQRDYEKHAVEEQTEVLSLLGDVSARDNGQPQLHLHAVLGTRNADAIGGHLLQGRVRPTLEVIFTESPAHLRRVHDPRAGLAVIKP